MADPAVAPTDDAAPLPAINDQIEAARKSGYSDQEIGDYLKSSSAWAPHFQAAAKAGYSDDEVFGHLGLNPKETKFDRTLREVDEQGTRALKRIGSAAAEGYGDEAFPSILSPEAQEKLEQSDGLVNRYINAPLARVAGTAGALMSGAFRGAQQGLQEIGEAAVGPEFGRDLAGSLEAFADARVPGAAEREALHGAAHDIRRQMRAEPPPAEATTRPAEPIGPESGMVVRPNPEDVEAQPAAPAQPVPAQAAPLDAAVQAERARTAPRTPEQAAIDEEAEAQPAPAPAAAPPEPQVPRETPADPTPAETQAGPPARYVMLRPDQLKVDPERFQYKASDEKGVTGALVGTDRWEPLLSDPITAWEDLDGQLYVVNGHQRTDLARRAEAAGQPDVQIPAEIFRAADGNSPEFMRVMGAYKNIGQGSGTAIDAARVLRGKDAIPESVRLPELPPNQQIVKQARGLAALDDHAWGMVTNGIIPPEQAAVVGDLVKDPAQQSAIMGEIARAKNPPQTAAQAQFMVQDILHSGFLDQIEKNQGALFGADDLPQTLFGERAQILDGAQRAVNRARTVFNSAVKGEDTLTGAGNKLDTAGNLAAKAENDRLIEFIRREAVNRGPLSDALTAAARDIAAGKPPGPAISGFLVEARRLERSGEGAGVPHGAVERGTGAENHPDELGAALFEQAPPLWHLPPERLQEMLDEKSASDDERLVKALGPDGAKRFKALDRASNSTDRARADAASAALEKIEAGMTADQRRLIYGIGDTDAQAHEIAAVLDAHEPLHLDARGNGPSIEDVVREATLGLRRMSPREILNVPVSGGSAAAQAAYLRLMRGYEELRARGILADDVPRTMVEGMHRATGMSLGDAAEFVGEFLKEAKRDQRVRLHEPGDHTFRNDPRQEGMFGGPSAVQAQAARDQAGRGGLNAKAPQKPMDEGLFAKPEVPTGDLFAKPDRPTASKWTQPDTGARDEMAAIPDHAGGHAAAAAFVREAGARDGFEHAIIVDRDGNIVHAATNGQPRAVDVPFNSMLPDGQQYTLHHNHPGASALSQPDILSMAHPSVGEVVAHAHDGTMDAARLTEAWQRKLEATGATTSTNWEDFVLKASHFQAMLRKASQRATDGMREILQPLVRSGHLTMEEAKAFTNDVANRLLHAADVIDYMTNRTLPEIVQKAIDDHVQAGSGYHADRPPVSVRPEGGTDGVREGGGDRPVEGSAGDAGSRGRSAPEPGPPLRRGEQGRLFEGLREDQERDLFKGAPDAVNRGYEIIKSKTGFAKAIAEIRAFFSPTEARGAKPMEFMVNRMGAEAAADYKRAEHALQAVRWAMDKAGEATQLDFIKRYERGEKQATPEMQKLSDVLHDVTGGWTKKIQGMGKGLLQNAIDDYMGHIYSNYEQWKSGAEGKDPSADGRAAAAMVGKRPLTGSGNFLKQRTFPTLDDAIRAGLKPITTNPVDLQLMKLREMQKFYHGQRLADQIKAAPFSTFVRPGDEWAADRAGLVKLDDRIFQPRLRMEGVPGKVEPGNWYAPEPIARVFNRYMSRGLYGQSVIYDTFRSAGNALNSLQLSLSGFHAAFIMNDVLTSRLALGLRQAFSGDFAKAAGSIASVPAAPITTLRNGARLQKALLAGADAPAGMRRAVEDMMIAGGRASMDQFYRSTTSGPFFRTLGDLKHPESVLYQGAQMLRDANGPIEKAVMVPLRMAGRVLDTTMQPLMGHMVPLAKMGVFDELARDWHERHPGATPEERQHAMTQFWDSVDNRMGQLAYDRLYWNKAAKDIAFIGMRSVGWNLGSFREIVGAAPDAARYARDVVQGKRPDLTTRMSYVMAMPMVTATIGGMITYALTGAPPEKLLDYFFPLGRIIPGYMKDVIEFTKAPVQTILNKAHPLIGTGIELYHNRDYFGGIIYDPKRDPSAAAAYADYLTNQMLPFSFRNMQKMNQQGLSLLDQSLAFWGLGQAPQSIVNPERMQHFQDIEDKKAYRRREREQGRVHIFTGP